ncbi:hypothetical protein [Motilimonas eburnea]|uniref:hypothetical protein n=1 Tax=Motilimonas eburnea TaxID=1737488 RepID=UPI001E41BF4F|nr:hypothetical protein [Motilimonas eburnea]MCE2570545.1 hypothetical protein [Motilimonas eburnea]
MFISRAEPEQINTNRLDADFYRPEYLNVEQKLSTVATALLGSCGKFFAGPFGSKLPSNLYLKKGVPLFRVGNVGQFEVITDNFAHLATDVHQELSSSEVLPGDLLIVKASVGEKIAKVPEWMPRANITQHIIGVRPNGTFDSDYICAFLYSKFGRSQLERFSLGSIIQYLGVNDARSVLAYKPSSEVQKYIGDKVRQAERLRAWAKEVQAQAQTEIPLYLSQVPRYENKFFTAERSELNPLRLDASFYHPDHIELDQKMRAVGCNRLGAKCTLVKSAWDKKSKHFAYFEIGGLNISNGTIDPSIVKTEEAPSRAKTGIKMGDVLVSTVRPNRKNVAFVSEDYSPLPIVATSGFSVLRFSSLEKAAFFHAWLRGDDATHQLMRWNSGSAYPAIDDDVPLNILIPEFGEAFVSEWGEKLLSSHLASTASKQLVISAKLLVEALIEGAVTEQQLIDAQVALDADDSSLDREVLARLAINVLDGDGDKLFPDLDQLYDLLTQSQQLDE